MAVLVFFFNDTATTEIYTLSLHDALPICRLRLLGPRSSSLLAQSLEDIEVFADFYRAYYHSILAFLVRRVFDPERSEEHTSELQLRQYLVCRLLLEKKKIPQHLSSLLFYL